MKKSSLLLLALPLALVACGVGALSTFEPGEVEELWSLGDELTLRQCSVKLFDGGLPPARTANPDGGRDLGPDRATVCAVRDCLLEGRDGGLFRRDGTPVVSCADEAQRVRPDAGGVVHDGGR